MAIRKSAILLASLGVLSLTACGGKTDPSRHNFAAAMNQYLAAKGDLCIGARRWPVEVSDMDIKLGESLAYGIAPQMAALEAAGLVASNQVDVDIIGIMGKPTGGKAARRQYTLTERAKPFEKPNSSDTAGSPSKIDLCWGKKALDKVVKWEGPMRLGDYQEVGVTYTYKINDVADWAKAPGIQAAFPQIKRALDGAGKDESRHALKLTSEGWEAKGLNSSFF